MAPPRTRTAFGTALITALAAAGTLGAPPASAWFLSPGEAASDGADEAQALYWIGLVVAVAAAVAVNAALVLLVRRYRARRGRAPEEARLGPGQQIRVGGALVALFAVLAVAGIVFTERSAEVEAAADEAEPVQITATGQQWLWRYDYPDGVYSYYRLVVPAGTEVELDVVSTDVVHSWLVPALGAKVDAVPGKRNHFSFVADEEGTLQGASATFSGQAYAAMRTEVEVVSPEEFEDFLERRAEETAEAQAEAAETYAEREGLDVGGDGEDAAAEDGTGSGETGEGGDGDG